MNYFRYQQPPQQQQQQQQQQPQYYYQRVPKAQTIEQQPHFYQRFYRQPQKQANPPPAHTVFLETVTLDRHTEYPGQATATQDSPDYFDTAATAASESSFQDYLDMAQASLDPLQQFREPAFNALQFVLLFLFALFFLIRVTVPAQAPNETKKESSTVEKTKDEKVIKEVEEKETVPEVKKPDEITLRYYYKSLDGKTREITKEINQQEKEKKERAEKKKKEKEEKEKIKESVHLSKSISSKPVTEEEKKKEDSEDLYTVLTRLKTLKRQELEKQLDQEKNQQEMKKREAKELLDALVLYKEEKKRREESEKRKIEEEKRQKEEVKEFVSNLLGFPKNPPPEEESDDEEDEPEITTTTTTTTVKEVVKQDELKESMKESKRDSKKESKRESKKKSFDEALRENEEKQEETTELLSSLIDDRKLFFHNGQLYTMYTIPKSIPIGMDGRGQQMYIHPPQNAISATSPGNLVIPSSPPPTHQPVIANPVANQQLAAPKTRSPQNRRMVVRRNRTPSGNHSIVNTAMSKSFADRFISNADKKKRHTSNKRGADRHTSHSRAYELFDDEW
ncbi:unnamed protein product [Ambrosiozyma monospora]|uniref:Unnamed protein product n=1 Tax=Ambrosiozyma monospora TaxID=43982 RepID=A0ACB5SVB4_AMBMO|nr:unnamed protein product [Ambrosiozyma monospora]